MWKHTDIPKKFREISLEVTIFLSSQHNFYNQNFMRFTLMVFLLCAIVQLSWGQLRTVEKDDGYSYWLYIPKEIEEADAKLPILVFLHGRSLSGNDLAKVKRYGVLRAMERGKDLQAIVVAPQTSNGWNADRVVAMVDEVLEGQGGDHDRVYVCGMSMGGYGTMDVAGAYPDRIAAAVAICGGGTVALACNLAKVPLWIHHGNNDRIVPMAESKKIYTAIKQCDPHADATLTIIPGGTHGSVERLFHQDEIYDWMFQYTLER